MRPPATLAGLILAVLATLPAACGEDRGPPLSAKEFRDRGNAICRAGDVELAKRGDELAKSGRPDLERLARFFTDDALPIARRKLDQLADLRPPEADEKEVEKLVSAGRKAVDTVENGLRKDPEGYLVSRGPDPFEDFNQRAVDLGLDDCVGESAKLQ
jgi:hypothetical protein